MSGPFTVDEATELFSGFFRSSHVGLVENVLDDWVWCMIKDLSKCDADGQSMKGWVDSDKFPMDYFTSVWVAQLVSASPCPWPALCPCCQCIYALSHVFLACEPCVHAYICVSMFVCTYICTCIQMCTCCCICCPAGVHVVCAVHVLSMLGCMFVSTDV